MIPGSVSRIGDEAFSYCVELTSAALPAGLTAIGENLFSYCGCLTEVTIPAGTKIGEDAFDCCYALTLTVAKGSPAERYCIEEDIPYSLT